MAIKIRPAMVNIHLSAEKRNSATQDFLQEFNKRRKTGNIDNCLTYCHIDIKQIAAKTRKGALRLMVGVSDDDEDGFDFKASGLTVAKDGMVTGALEVFLIWMTRSIQSLARVDAVLLERSIRQSAPRIFFRLRHSKQRIPGPCLVWQL